MLSASLRKYALTVSIVLGLSALAVPGFAQQTSGIQWGHDLDAAKAAAAASGKLVLVHFWTPECGPCRLLDKQVFNQPTVAGPIQQKFVPVKLNANEFPATAQAFGITRVPTDVIINAQGQVIQKIVSPATPMAYVGRVSQISAEHDSKGGNKYQQAAAQSPYGPTVNNAYASLALAPGVPPRAGQQATQQPATVPVAGASATGQVANPYAQSQQVPTQQAAPANPAVGDRYASMPAQQSVTNPYATQPATPPQQPASAPATTQQVATQLPAGSPPLGFEGYCPVSMKLQTKWVKGDTKWGAIHRGRTYLFAGQSQRDAFLGSPDSFSPVLSGVDPVLAVEQGKAVEGKRKYGVDYRGQFYLFSSEETLNRFWTNPAGYSEGVRQAMSATPGRTVR